MKYREVGGLLLFMFAQCEVTRELKKEGGFRHNIPRHVLYVVVRDVLREIKNLIREYHKRMSACTMVGLKMGWCDETEITEFLHNMTEYDPQLIWLEGKLTEALVNGNVPIRDILSALCLQNLAE